ncbi:hypothetical protein C8F04DRAFT_1255833 [Mycena alexandri]|uniref:F-box domain-containing protein n=1 Tax=Mycena alexandri TaxID=1745969 RepID=A0AAD6X7R7_9AGAR|nr:hypothetical protein C8F04DRAFT_1255833 [Mycena alexandri]
MAILPLMCCCVRALSSVADSLPIDVVSCILVEFLGSFHEAPLEYEESKLCASMVSKDWLCALNATPLLWSCAVIDNYTNLVVLCRGLDKAGSLPLHIRFDMVARDLLLPAISSPRQIRAFLQQTLISLHLYLCRCIYLDLSTSDATTTATLLLLLGGMAFPMLSRLRLDLHYTTMATAHTLLAFPRHALSRLDITNGSIELQPAMYSTLSTLIMRGQLYTRWPHFVECLTHLVRLVNLEFYDVACVGASSYQKVLDQPILLLPSIRHFKLSASFTSSAWILAIIRFPSLWHLQLVVADLLTLATLARVAGSIFHSTGHLELSLLSSSADALVTLLAPMTSLISLDAWGSNPSFGRDLLVAMGNAPCLSLNCKVIRLPSQRSPFVDDLLKFLQPCGRSRTWFMSVSPARFMRIETCHFVEVLYSSYDQWLTRFST